MLSASIVSMKVVLIKRPVMSPRVERRMAIAAATWYNDAHAEHGQVGERSIDEPLEQVCGRSMKVRERIARPAFGADAECGQVGR